MKLENLDMISLWDSSAEENDFISDMDGDRTTDLAIVGAGFTGLSTALHAAETGIDCCVLEAKKIGYGGSGRNAGLVNAGMWLPPSEVELKLGKERSSKLLKQLGEAPEYVFSLIERFQIRCEARRLGTIHAAHSPSGFNDLERRADTWQSLGAPVELLSQDHAAQKIGTTVFHGGLLDHRAGTINPMSYARGLARAAKSAGANISTRVQVKKLSRKGDKWRLTTDKGVVTANTVVLGTNAYTDNLWPGLKKTFVAINYFQLATEPLKERAEPILPGGQGLWDTGRIMFSLRRDKFNRLIIGSMGTLLGGSGGLSERWATQMLKRLFPNLGPCKFETSWFGKIAMTPDHLPRIHRLSENLYTPIGYNGRGITTGTVFGKAMANLITGYEEDALPLPISQPRMIMSEAITSHAYEIAFKANQWWRSLL